MPTAWIQGLTGGALIGLAAALLLAWLGRIAGISGILGGVLRATPDRAWRVAFLAALMGAGALTVHALGQVVPSPASPPVLVVAGLLVGYGTSLGSGCTSGHGVCGLGRMSMRSLAAVLVFMATAFVTVYLTRHVLGGAA
jgi:uncharacterized membrane protein YedE/YeeE